MLELTGRSPQECNSATFIERPKVNRGQAEVLIIGGSVGQLQRILRLSLARRENHVLEGRRYDEPLARSQH